MGLKFLFGRDNDTHDKKASAPKYWERLQKKQFFPPENEKSMAENERESFWRIFFCQCGSGKSYFSLEKWSGIIAVFFLSIRTFLRSSHFLENVAKKANVEAGEIYIPFYDLAR